MEVFARLEQLGKWISILVNIEKMKSERSLIGLFIGVFAVELSFLLFYQASWSWNFLAVVATAWAFYFARKNFGTGKKDGKEPRNLGDNMVASEVIHGKVDRKVDNKNTFLAADGTKGAVRKYVGEGGELKEEIHGGTDVMIVGHKGKDLEHMTGVFKEVAGDYIELRIPVTKRRKVFARKFQRKQTIQEVMWAIEDDYNEKYQIFRGNKELEGHMTLAEADQKGGVWEARKVTEDTGSK